MQHAILLITIQSGNPPKEFCMFVTGKKYDIEMNDGADQNGEPCITTYPNRTVVDVQYPLIKINSGGKEEIINTSSPVFVRARLCP